MSTYAPTKRMIESQLQAAYAIWTILSTYAPKKRMIESQLQAAYAIRTIFSTYAPTERMIESQLQASSRRKVDSRHIGSLLPVVGRPLREDKAMIIESPLQRGPLPSKLPLLPLLRSPPRPIFPLTRGNSRSLLSSRLRYRITL